MALSTTAAGGESWLDRQASPPLFFLAGMALIPAFLLQDRLSIRAAQVLLFLGLALAGGSRGKGRLLGTSGLLLAATVAFNLMAPFGRVLVRWGPMTVTQGALTVGLNKGLTLVGLMVLSRFSVRRTVRLPGRLGLYVSATLFYLNGLLEGRPRGARGGLSARLDALFGDVYGMTQPPRDTGRQPGKPAGITVLALLVAANWGALFLSSGTLLGGFR